MAPRRAPREADKTGEAGTVQHGTLDENASSSGADTEAVACLLHEHFADADETDLRRLASFLHDYFADRTSYDPQRVADVLNEYLTHVLYWTQQRLSIESGVPLRTLQNVLTAHTKRPPSCLRDIENTLGLPPGTLCAIGHGTATELTAEVELWALENIPERARHTLIGTWRGWYAAETGRLETFDDA